MRDDIRSHINSIPKLYGHEHIGSLSSFGTRGPIFASDEICGKLPAPETGLYQLLYSPYLAGHIGQHIGQQTDYEKIYAVLRRIQNRGTVKALEIALKDLYGTDFEKLRFPGEFASVNAAVQNNYRNYYGWYETVFQIMNCRGAVRTVHPHYLIKQGPGANTEKKYNIPLIRVDTLLGYWENGAIRFGYFEELSGVKCDDIDTFEYNIDYFFHLTDEHKICGLKQFQAYYRTLQNETVSREAAARACGDLSDKNNVIILQDYLLHRFYAEANKRGMSFQIHTGMTTLKNSNPMLLEDLFSMYPGVNFVLLHCYPFISEAAYLASRYGNVSVDTSWLALQGEAVLEKAFTEYLSIVPCERILASVDSTGLEEFYGGHVMTQSVLAGVLETMLQKGYIGCQDACAAAETILYQNAMRLYVDWRARLC